MKRLLFIFCIAIVLAVPARAGLTLVTRETFQGVGTLNSGAPGNLGTVVGNFYKRPVGPRLASDTTASSRGWSADNAGSEPYQVWGGTAYNSPGMMCGWFFLGASANGSTSPIRLLKCQNGGGEAYGLTYASGSGLTTMSDNQYGVIQVPYVSVPTNSWVWLAVAWSGGQFASYYKFPGGTLQTLGTFNSGVTPTGLLAGFFGQYSGNGTVRGRYGMPSLYSIGTFADVAYPSDVIDPPAGPFAWYCNPATGNDGNDGTTPATAWASVAKINAESASVGMFPSVGGMGTGDTLYLNGSAAPLTIGSAQLQLSTQGMTLSCAGAEPIKPWTAVTGAWTLSSGCASTYETTDGAATDLTSVVLLEDWKILNHPTGANFAAVQAAMEATPGSFYSDGVKLYVHPFGNTIPGADGKTYIRSRARPNVYGIPGGSVISVLAPDVHITSTQPGGSLLRMSMLVRSTDSDPVGSYLLQWDANGGGTNQVDNFHFDLGSKHLEGRTTQASNMSVARVDCVYGQGSPYCGFGGQTQAVDYCQGGTGNTYSYLRCSSTVNAGLVGSTAGTVNWAYQSWLSHGDTSGVFSNGTFTDCNWCSVIEEDGAASGTVSLLRTTLGGATAFNANLTADQCRTTLFPLSVQNGKTMILRNCILGLAVGVSNYYWAPLAGTVTVRGVTINFGDNPGGSSPGAVWGRAGACNLTIQNVLLLASSTHPHTLLDGFTSADTIAMDHNAYANGTATVVQRYNDGTVVADRTLAQWQLLKEDAGSFATSAATVDANLKPIPGSQLIDAGSDLGNLPDFTGKLFAHRTTIAAYEPPPATYAQWQNDYFTTAQLNDASSSGALANPAGDGCVNLLKYAFNLDPGSLAPASAFPTASSDGLSVAITYTQSLWVTDLTYTVERSTDLIHWTPATPTNTVLGSDGVMQQIRAQVPYVGSGRLFLHLRVSHP